MTLKFKISLLITLLFSVLFGIAAAVIYSSFSEFRKDEFESRLEDKAISSTTLLIDVQEIDRHMLKIIDQNSIHKLFNEKTLIFDSKFNLLYSSLDDTKIDWTIDDLNNLKANKKSFKKVDNYEILGIEVKSKNEYYYAIVSASDTNGFRKLSFLSYLLIFTYFIFTAICWFVTSFAVKKLLSPLDNFLKKIKTINENSLDTRLEVKQNKDEIDGLAFEFNLMLQRINQSYQKQKEFTAHASHELRTPISRIITQLENRLLDKNISEESKEFLRKILDDSNQISELVSSLLLLANFESKQLKIQKTNRIDELIYDSIEQIHNLFPEFKISFDIEYSESIDHLMEIRCSRSLMLIALTNLLKNACIYSDNNQANVLIAEKNDKLILQIKNSGNILSEEERKNLFQPFMRGKNSSGKNGLGLGLKIVQRILHQHHFEIKYETPNTNQNVFEIMF